MKNPKKEAAKLLQTLKDKANKNPNIFCENYGQKEIRKFEDKLNSSDVHYTEKCEAMNIVNAISLFTPFN
jgi:hypothetical protein